MTEESKTNSLPTWIVMLVGAVLVAGVVIALSDVKGGQAVGYAIGPALIGAALGFVISKMKLSKAQWKRIHNTQARDRRRGE